MKMKQDLQKKIIAQVSSLRLEKHHPKIKDKKRQEQSGHQLT